MNKKISLLGSTGSIGLNTIQVIQFYKFYFQIESLSAHKNIEELRKQILEFRPKKAVITDLEKYREFIHLYGNPFYKCKIYYGYDALIDLVQDIEVDIVINALVGIYGLKPSLEAIRKNKTLAIANKETIIVSGSLLMRELKKSKGQLIPIDSEHSALFSLIGAFNKEKIKKLFLTASGGAIYNRSLEDLEHISLEEILMHPNWKMGKKITVDSATMMNKGFELIEAHYLFDYSLDKIEVVIHPQSYVHAIIQTHDLAYYSQMSIPDMRLPIQNSLTYPEIWENPFLKDSKNNLLNYPDLNFSKVDYKKYPLLELVYQVAERGDSYPIILNAANDIAVYAFLEKKINFLDIYPMIEKILLQYSPIKINHEDDILNLDLEIRNKMTTDLLS